MKIFENADNSNDNNNKLYFNYLCTVQYQYQYQYFVRRILAGPMNYKLQPRRHNQTDHTCLEVSSLVTTSSNQKQQASITSHLHHQLEVCTCTYVVEPWQ